MPLYSVACVTAVAGVHATDDILMLGGAFGDDFHNFAAVLAVAFDPAFTDVLAPVMVFLNTPRGVSVLVRVPKVFALDSEALGGLAKTVKGLLEAVRVLFEAVRVCRGSECLETCSTGPKAWSVVEERV